MNIFQTLIQHTQSVINTSHNALRLGIACFLLFSLSKVYLIAWYYFNQDLNILTTVEMSKWPLLPAMDIAVSVVILVAIFVCHFLNGFLPKADVTNKFISIVTFSAVAMFIMVSFKSQLVYGSPLTIDLYRSAGDLTVMKDSILSYIGIEEFVLIVIAISSYWVSGPILRSICPQIYMNNVKHVSLLLIVILSLLIVPPVMAYSAFYKVYTFSLKKNSFVHFARYYHPAPSIFNTGGLKEKLLKGVDQEFVEGLLHHSGYLTPEKSFKTNHMRYKGSAEDMNLLLVMLESTGAPHFTSESSPTLFSLRDHSLNFVNHYTTGSSSIQSAYSIFYSDYIGRFDLRSVYGEKMPNASLAELFQKNNYTTAVFQSGFLSYSDFGYLWENKGVETLVGASEIFKSSKKAGWSWGAFEESTVNSIEKWLQKNHKKKFFLTYRPVFPHQPYYSPKGDVPFTSGTWEDKHKNSVYYVDDNIKQLLQLLEKYKLRENTVVAVVADHGETTSRFPVGHGLSMSEEEIHVPFFIHQKNIFLEKDESLIFSNHLDVSPTLASLFGLNSSADWKGRSLIERDIANQLLYISSNHSLDEGIIDNGYLYTINRNTLHEEIKDLKTQKHTDKDTVLEEMDFFNKAAEDFQKWSVWHHLP